MVDLLGHSSSSNRSSTSPGSCLNYMKIKKFVALGVHNVHSKLRSIPVK